MACYCFVPIPHRRSKNIEQPADACCKEDKRPVVYAIPVQKLNESKIGKQKRGDKHKSVKNIGDESGRNKYLFKNYK